ncbi:MAG TPA: HPF/RaiA family ribosome-associated protein [Polyangiales bacterium]|nr:HPF/RaiA family ribosome-associated protein [Polyangiales bacterium]
MREDNMREALADTPEIAEEAQATLQVPLEIRSLDGKVDGGLYAWIRERLSRHLGKFATQMERVEVRFSDENGPKGGVDRRCLVHLVLSSLPPIVVEDRGETDRVAFDLAAGRAERALKHSLNKHSFSMKRGGLRNSAA